MLDGLELKFNLIKDISDKLGFYYQAIHHPGKKDPFDKENGVGTYSIIKLVQTYYVNNKNKFDAVVPKDTAIIALTTKLNFLEGKLKNQGGSNSSKGSSGSSGGDNNKKGRK
eukprot:4324889-Ditylum_brightwellii.AAC.1